MVLEKTVVYSHPLMDEIRVETVQYQSKNGEALTLNVYYPPKSETRKMPAVVYVFGFPDGVEMIGGKLKDTNAYISWAKLTAATGFTSIQYETTEPMKDIYKVMEYVMMNADSLRIDENRIGIWVCSGNAPTALRVLMDDNLAYPQCAVIYYGMMLDWEENLGIRELSKRFEFFYPDKIKPFSELRNDVPLFMVRAGHDDFPNCNDSQDEFIVKALENNLPLTLINYHEGHHAFDMVDDNDESRAIIKQTLEFLKIHLKE
jgi:dipeptidyl aminopeptidase/acylaminoacyl peptidase